MNEVPTKPFQEDFMSYQRGTSLTHNSERSGQGMDPATNFGLWRHLASGWTTHVYIGRPKQSYAVGLLDRT